MKVLATLSPVIAILARAAADESEEPPLVPAGTDKTLSPTFFGGRPSPPLTPFPTESSPRVSLSMVATELASQPTSVRSVLGMDLDCARFCVAGEMF